VLAHSLLAVAVLLLAIGASTAAPDTSAMHKRGEELLTTNCASCHAVGRTGDSIHKDAPTFRSLSKRYPIETLAESLAEGLFTGHPDMPEYTFEAPDVGAILAYLESIQER
jgi:mono/diheme cytochrome c family protein